MNEEIRTRVESRLRAWQQASFARRLWERDPTLWSPEPVPELADRLGWLALPATMAGLLDDLEAFARETRDAGIRHAVLLGMGGSSLAPEVFQNTFGSTPGYPELIVLDSTHPDAVRAASSRIDLRHSLFLVSSKSGTTIETLSLFEYFWEAVGRAVPSPGAHFAAVTDPGTPLARMVEERGFRRTFLAPPEVGGRFSALSVFGLVPAALVRVDLRRLLDRARQMAQACGAHIPAPENPGLVLGAVLGEAALVGRDKLTLLSPASFSSLPAWIEQLVAESTGKDGRGIVPVVGEPPAAFEAYGADRVFVSLGRGRAEHGAGADVAQSLHALSAAGHPVIRIYLDGAADLGAEFFRWEVAVAAACAVLGVHPFNQPDVQLAKDLAQRAMARAAHGQEAGEAPEPVEAVEVSAAAQDALAEAIRAWQAQVRDVDYVGLQAYLAPSDQVDAALQEIRGMLGGRMRVATTSGYGPRFLHSAGQLHKGGPATGVFLQLVDDPAEDLPVPGTGYTFGMLIRAQALGDLRALRQRGRRVLRVNLGADAVGGLDRIVRALRSP
jgi:transaldolase/glucose-6-phosphate isomerase